MKVQSRTPKIYAPLLLGHLAVSLWAGQAHGVVTISAGLAAMVAGTAMASEKLLRAADEVLFDAKRGGRNQVRCAVAPAPAPVKA